MFVLRIQLSLSWTGFSYAADTPTVGSCQCVTKKVMSSKTDVISAQFLHIFNLKILTFF